MITFKPLFGYLAEHHITLTDLSEMTDITVTTLTRMKKTGSFSRNTLDKICSVLKIDIRDVMRYDD